MVNKNDDFYNNSKKKKLGDLPNLIVNDKWQKKKSETFLEKQLRKSKKQITKRGLTESAKAKLQRIIDDLQTSIDKENGMNAKGKKSKNQKIITGTVLKPNASTDIADLEKQLSAAAMDKATRLNARLLKIINGDMSGISGLEKLIEEALSLTDKYKSLGELKSNLDAVMMIPIISDKLLKWAQEKEAASQRQSEIEDELLSDAEIIKPDQENKYKKYKDAVVVFEKIKVFNEKTQKFETVKKQRNIK